MMGVWYVLKNGRWVSLAPRFPYWLIKWPRRMGLAWSLWRKWHRENPNDPRYAPWADIEWRTAWQVACGIWD